MSISIERIKLCEIRLPLKEPFQISSGIATVRRILLLQLTDAEGISVWSECVAGEHPNYSPETIDTAWLAIRDWIAPRVLDRPFATPSELHHELQRDFRGHNMAKAAIEMGSWAIAAERQGKSLSLLLAGTRDRIGTGISIGIQEDPATLVAKASQALAAGYRKIKLKVKPGADVDYVAAVRAELGDAAPIMVDANNAYGLDDLDRLKQLDEFDLIMIEQPLAWDDLVRHATLQQQLKTPICLDESITSLERAEDMITLGAGRIINIKPARVGGFTQSLAIHHLCVAKDIRTWCGGMLESGVGRSYNVALASLPNFTLPGDLSPSSRYWERDIVSPEWTMDGTGMVTVPRDEPGIGVKVDVDRIDDLTHRSQTISS
ncbi:MAG: o-succinylbenzoate synthase [Gemmatimonadota bacterium]|nr:MAG: o-succinylbenzoate synthase [Gemmatimonadota bacterium]